MSRRRKKRKQSTPFGLFAFQDIITCVMGVMLLLTLVLSLQVVSQAGPLSPENDTRSIEDVVAARERLELRIAALKSQLDQNAHFISDGALLDAESAKQRLLDAQLAADGVQKDIARLHSRQTSAQKIASELAAEAESREPQTQDRIKLEQEVAEAHRQLKQLRSGNRVVYNRSINSGPAWIIEVDSRTSIRCGPIGVSQEPKSFRSISSLNQWIRSQSTTGFLMIFKPRSGHLKDSLETTARDAGHTVGFDLLPADQFALDAKTGAL